MDRPALTIEAAPPPRYLLGICVSGFVLTLVVWLTAAWTYHPLIHYAYTQTRSEFLRRLVKHRVLHTVTSDVSAVDFSVFLVWMSLLVAAVYLLADHLLAGKLHRRVLVGLRGMATCPRTFLVMTSIVMLVITSGVAYFGLGRFPNSADEYGYVFQAETLRAGRLWNDLHPKQEFFGIIHIAQKDGKRVGQFPPGWPILLALGETLRIPPWLVNPILAVGSLFLLFALAGRLYGRQVAVVSVLTVALSAFFVFNAASWFAHPACALFVLLFFYFGVRFVEEDKLRHALAAGAFIGAAFLVRYYTALLCGVPWGVYVLARRRKRGALGLLLAAAGAAPLVLFLLTYNHRITGDPLLTVQTWYAQEWLGFVKGHTPAKAVVLAASQLLNFSFWASAVVLVTYFGYLLVFWRKPRPHFTDLTFLVLLIGYLFYYNAGGFKYGPRYYYEGYALAVLLPARRLFGDEFTSARGRTLRYLFVLGVLACVWVMPWIVAREHRIVVERTDLYRQVEAKGIHNAVVFVASGTGVTRPMPQGDLPRNGITFDGDVLYALDLGEERRGELMNHYPNRAFYVYSRQKDHVQGNLVGPIRRPSSRPATLRSGASRKPPHRTH